MFDFLMNIISDFLFFILHVNPAGSFPPTLSAEEEKDCLEKMKKGDKAAKNKLIEHNLRLVAHIIKKYYSGYSAQEDLISIGTIGLIKAVNTFKSDKGIRLATYASRCIENEILMHFRSQKKASQDISVNEPIDSDSDGNPLTLMDIIATQDTIVDDIYKDTMIKSVIKKVGNIKNDRERAIIILRYGLGDNPPLTQREIAKLMNISRSYVSRIEKKALNNLKSEFENESGK